jgi:hypothetical protein
MTRTELSYDAKSALRRMRVGVHLHDRGTLWEKNPAGIKAGDLCRWFDRTFIREGLAEAIAPSPYTNPDEYVRYGEDSMAMVTLENHRTSLADRERELGFPIRTSVEAQIVPVEPGNKQSLAYVLDIPDSIAARHDVVIASVHTQPAVTEKDPAHVSAMRYAALANPYVAWLSHIDRHVNNGSFPNLEFFEAAAAANTGFGISENYFATRGGVLKAGRPIRPTWGHFLDADRPMTPDEFEQAIDRRSSISREYYGDYRQSHLLALAVRAGTPLVAEFDWHVPTSPGGINIETGDLGPVVIARLGRLGQFFDLRLSEFDGEHLVVTSSLERFDTFRRLRHTAE